MKKIIIFTALGLVVGFGVSRAIESTDITRLEAENAKVKQQLAKLSEQVLVLQKQGGNSPRLSQRQASKTTTQQKNSKTLTQYTLNKSKMSEEAKLAQRKQAMERMRAQQKTNAQMHATEQDKNKVKTTKDGVVL